MLPLPLAILLIFACLVGAIAPYPVRRCVKCGRNRAGRMAGGTVDDPICIECINGGGGR
jgi:hypothetical protein